MGLVEKGIDKLETLRLELNKTAMALGTDHIKVLRLSQELDILIVSMQKGNLEIKP